MTIRHFVLLITVFLSWINASASHVYNGDLSYEYVGNTTGIANQYKVNLTLYYESPSSIPSSVYVKVCSSCYATTSLWVTLDTGLIPIGNIDPCVTNQNQFYANHYSGLIVLPGLCSDFSFQITLDPRNPAIDNLINPGSSHATFKINLNNSQGPNSSPKFISYPVLNYCVGQNAIWANPFIENDGDSILVQLATPLDGTGGTCFPTQLAFAPGYSPSQPITTTPPQSAAFIGNTPFLAFKPAALEIVTLRLEILEFRNDTNWGMNYLVGSSTRDVTFFINLNCNPIAAQGVLLDYNTPGLYIDPASGLPTMDFWCHDSTFILPFATPVRCNSIAPDGSDFRLASSGGLPIPIKKASANCDSLNETREITLTLFNPITSNGDYFLYSKIGNDGNTLLNSCGFAMSEYDTLLLRVTNCSGIGLEEPVLNNGISIPNTFTPNGDGTNDFFSITIPPAEKGAFSLQIFTRSGQVVYTNHAYTGQPWDGSLDGKPLPDGVYFVVLTQVKRNDAMPEVRKQHLTLVR